MKNKFVLVLVALAFMACRKDRVCNCTVTVNGTSTSHTQTLGLEPLVSGIDTTITQPLVSVNTDKKSYKKVKKKEMYSNCPATTQETINRSTNNVVPGIYTVTTSDQGTKTYDCKIE